jgi:hypothetical protein
MKWPAVAVVWPLVAVKWPLIRVEWRDGTRRRARQYTWLASETRHLANVIRLLPNSPDGWRKHREVGATQDILEVGQS